MGNHEYCIDCGESDFHSGKECNPEKYAKHQAEERRNTLRAEQATAKMKKKLDAAGIKYSINKWGDFDVSKWNH